MTGHVSIPIPMPRFADEEAGILGYQRFPGQPLLGRFHARAPHELGRFLRGLHAIHPATAADLIPTEDADPDAWLDDLDAPRDLPTAARHPPTTIA